jgi:hypothetical protein
MGTARWNSLVFPLKFAPYCNYTLWSGFGCTQVMETLLNLRTISSYSSLTELHRFFKSTRSHQAAFMDDRYVHHQ